jgi:hypothetical protein
MKAVQPARGTARIHAEGLIDVGTLQDILGYSYFHVLLLWREQEQGYRAVTPAVCISPHSKQKLNYLAANNRIHVGWLPVNTAAQKLPVSFNFVSQVSLGRGQ